MIKTQKVKVKWNPSNKKYYEELGYTYTKMGEEFEVKVEDLTKSSKVEVLCCCDSCNKELKWKYQSYNKYVKEEGKTYCRKCAMKLYGIEHYRKSRSNNIKKSFAQWLIEEYGDNALELYWDYNKNTVDPWKISYRTSRIKIWIKCQEKYYHGSYEINCANFSSGHRCPYCSSRKIHPLDSLKQSIINEYGEEFFNIVWSDKNTIDPINLKPNSFIECWWNCPKGKHKPFKRSCSESKEAKYRCPNCYEPLKGDDSPRWNPNLTQEERELSRHIEGYNEWRKQVYERDNYTCQCCKNKQKNNLNAHHLNGYNWDKEHRLDIGNGITLCEEFHRELKILTNK